PFRLNRSSHPAACVQSSHSAMCVWLPSGFLSVKPYGTCSGAPLQPIGRRTCTPDAVALSAPVSRLCRAKGSTDTHYPPTANRRFGRGLLRRFRMCRPFDLLTGGGIALISSHLRDDAASR